MPNGKRIGSLRTIEEIATEYRRIYRLCRNDKMELSDGKGYCWMLKQLSGMIAEAELEKRVEEIEARLNEHKRSSKTH